MSGLPKDSFGLGGGGSIFRLMRASVNSKNKYMFQCRHNAVTRMADDTTHMESIFKGKSLDHFINTGATFFEVKRNRDRLAQREREADCQRSDVC